VLVLGNQVAGKLLDGLPEGEDPAWTNLPLPAATPSPWGIESRSKADGGKVSVLSSLASGQAKAEQATGTLRSRPFAAPGRLAFQLCGHDGTPGEKASGLNRVRLVDAADGTELRQALPPRHDVAREVVWDLGDLSGRRVRLEVVDGHTGDAYAWLAVGDFDPPVLQTGAFGTEAAMSGRLAKLAALLKYAAPPVLRDRLAVFLPAPPPAPPSMVSAEQQALVDRTIAARVAAYAGASPDKSRGAAVFATHCAICHAIGGKGSLTGPQLDGIGNRGAARLAEDILDPGKNVDAHFRLHVITRQDGSVLAGLERGEAGQVLMVVDAAGQEHRVPRAEIKSNEETALSLMPAAFGQSIPEADFNDLMAWLLDQRGS
jgi:putative heme-binding domain-containing protein